MADFNKAVQAVLGHEGTKLLDDPQTGEYSRFGITLKSAAALGYCEPDEKEFIENLHIDQAISIYRDHWWKPLLLDGIRNQDVATKLLDMSVNMGLATAVILLQRSMNDLKATLSVDGRMGPATLTAANAADPFELLTELRANSTHFYYDLVQKDPARYSRYWDEWKGRAAS